MPASDIRVVDDVAEAFSDVVLHALAAHLAGQVGGQGKGALFSLVLSGGPTAERCYRRLAARSAVDTGVVDAGVIDGGPIDWASVEVLMGDERCVGPDDPDANQGMVRRSLLDPVAAAAVFHPMSCGAAGVAAYQSLLENRPTLDLVHLGVGPDGHTASLFPGSEALDAPPGQLVSLNDDPRGRNPHQRMTLTLAGLARARLVVFTVAGEAKRAVWAQLRAGQALPAARVRAGHVIWLVDRDAAGE